MRKILLDMYLNKNLGDDLFLKIIAEQYPNVNFVTYPQTKYSVEILPKNVRARRSLFTQAINFFSKKLSLPYLSRFNRLKRQSDAVVTLGGSMFIERGLSDKELARQLSDRFHEIKRPYFIVGSNFGPYNNEYFLREHKAIFSKAEDVCFREKYSEGLFRDLSNVRSCPDLVFSLDAREYQSKPGKKVTISVINLGIRKNLAKYTGIYEAKIAEIAKFFLNNGYKVVLMSFCKNEGDESAIKRIVKKYQLLHTPGLSICNYRGDLDEPLRNIAESEYVIASRFHAVVLGLIFGKKVLPIIYSSKTKNMLEDMKFQGPSVTIDNLRGFEISEAIDKIKVYEKIPTQKVALESFLAFDDFLQKQQNGSRHHDKHSYASRKTELLKNTAIIMLGRFATQFISFLLLPIYTNFLSTSDYGTIDLIITYITLLAPVATFQQEMATFRYLVDARGDNQKIGEILTTSLIKVFSRTITFAGLYLVLCLFMDFPHKYLILGATVACILSNFFLQVARGLGQNVKYSVASVITGMLTLVINIVLICMLGWGGESLLVAMLFSNLICALYLVMSLELHRKVNRSSYDRSAARSMLKYSLPLVPNGISWWFINASDRTIVSVFLGAAANGIYAAANKVSTITAGLISIFSLSWTESASLHINDKDRDKFFSGVANDAVSIFSAICATIIAVLPFVFDLIIGQDFREAYGYIPIFIIASIFNGIVVIYSAIYVAKKMTKQVASTSIIAAIINLIINLGLVHFIGLYAAALSTAIAYFSMAIYRHFDLKKYLKIRYERATIVLAFVSLSVTTACYYIDVWPLKFVSLAIALICLTPSGKKMLLLLTKKRK